MLFIGFASLPSHLLFYLKLDVYLPVKNKFDLYHFPKDLAFYLSM